MTVDLQADDAPRITEMSAPGLSDPHARASVPRIWTVFVVYLAAFAATVLVQIIVGVVLAVWYLARGGSFRGYMQRRLLQRWSPAAAILVTTFLFAIMHIMPHAVVNAFVIGLWLGVLAWRTGSVWPGVVSHAFVNGSWNIWQIGKMLDVFPATPHVAVTAAIGAVVLGCFVASIRLLVRNSLAADPPAIETPQHVDNLDVDLVSGQGVP